MSEATMGLQFLGIMGTVAGTIASAFLVCDSDGSATKISRALKWSLLAASLTAWLWIPWVGYGIYRVAKTNLNQIEYCERPPNIIPAAPATIDLNKPPAEKTP